MIPFRLFGLLVLLVVVSGCVTTVRTSPSFDRQAVRTVGVMPVDMEFFLRTSTTTERRGERNAEVEAVFAAALAAVIGDGGMAVVPIALSDSALAADPELALGLTRSRESVGQQMMRVAGREKAALPLDVVPEVGRFADLADSDYLLFVRGTAFSSSGGAAARDVAIAAVTAVLFGGVAIRQQKGFAVEMALVDANTSQVVWFNRTNPGSPGGDPFSQAAVERHLRTLLRSLVGGR